MDPPPSPSSLSLSPVPPLFSPLPSPMPSPPSASPPPQSSPPPCLPFPLNPQRPVIEPVVQQEPAKYVRQTEAQKKRSLAEYSAIRREQVKAGLVTRGIRTQFTVDEPRRSSRRLPALERERSKSLAALPRSAPKRKAESPPDSNRNARPPPSQPLPPPSGGLQASRNIGKSLFDVNLESGFADVRPKVNTGISEAARKLHEEKKRKEQGSKPHPSTKLPSQFSEERAKSRKTSVLKDKPTSPKSKDPPASVHPGQPPATKVGFALPPRGSNAPSRKSPSFIPPPINAFRTLKEVKRVADYVIKNKPNEANKIHLIMSGVDNMFGYYQGLLKGNSSGAIITYQPRDLGEWGKVEGITLVNDQIATLTTKGEVDDTVLDALMKRIAAILKANLGVVLFEVDVWKSKLLVADAPDKQAFVESLMEAMQIKDLEVILFPLHSGNHYYVMFANVKNCRIYLFNPTQPEAKVDNAELLKTLKAVSDELKAATKNESWDYKDADGTVSFFEYKALDFPVQKDGINCCPVCVAFVMAYFYLPAAYTEDFRRRLSDLEKSGFRLWLAEFLEG